MSGLRWAAATLLAGLVVVQLAWVLAVPPYRGIDEFDHVYRAASLVDGQLRPYDEKVADGRGDYVRVPRDTVLDARPVCNTYQYVGPDNCDPVQTLDDGMVKIASAAARYNPAYYSVVGLAARASTGSEFVYVARLATVACCAALWALALLAAQRTERPTATFFALAVCATPVLTYSGSIVAPNGVEMVAAVATWTALLALGRQQTAASERLLLLVLAVAGSVLTTVRTLGPAWLLLIVLTICVLPGLRNRLGVVRRHPWLSAVTATVLLGATLLSAWWVLSARTNSLAEASAYDFTRPWLNALREAALWILQTVAAFPSRDDAAPTVVYAAVLAAWAIAFLTARGHAERRWRLTLLFMVLVWLVPPYLFTGLTFSQAGSLWQGRYSLPYAVGIALVLLSWQGATRARWRPGSTVALVAAAYVVATAVSVANVRRSELATSPLAGDDRWVSAPEPLLVLMAAGGTTLMFASWLIATRATRATRGRTLDAEVSAPERGP